ncbi:MAG: ATP-binding domain-containing protein [Chlorobium sp.]|nr:ATP-binding domain-containing protein [Chlorobium sp.]
MELSKETEQRIEILAEDTLARFEMVALAAKKALHDTHAIGTGTIANLNSITSTAAIQNLSNISQANKQSYQRLMNEPAIARVVVADENGRHETYYICRATPINGIPNFASYHSEVGRLAALSIGDEFTMRNGTRVEILERAKLRPSVVEDGWESRNTVVESDDFGLITIESLRTVTRKISETGPVVDRVAQLLAEEYMTSNVIEGVRRSVITKMGLRDQPILDRYQDEIFRLPLDMRLLLLGPPGTGKTTTLIRRLGQKLDSVFLNEDERKIVDNVTDSNGTAHTNSWLMFTPTELLKQYLKEAFAREDVPASDLRIRTWSDYRRELARNTFSVLRTAAGGGSYILKDSAVSLASDAHDNPILWFSDFNDWHGSVFIDDIRMSAKILSENPVQNIAELGRSLLTILKRAKVNNLVEMFTALAAKGAGIQSMVNALKEETDKKINDVLNLHLNRDRTFVDDLAKFIDGLQQVSDVDNDEFDDQDADEDEIGVSRAGRAAAVSAYIKAVRAQARAYVSKRNVGKNSRNGRIIEWLGGRTLSESDRNEVGASLLVQINARRFVNPVKRYIDGIPKRYRTFRRTRQAENKWYREEGFAPTDLHPLELDIILLAILKSANNLLEKQSVVRDIDSSFWSPLKRVYDLYKNQILVDEVTDFSPIQIACMSALAHPRIRSFFACGDFNQRLTTWGSHSIEDMKWVFPEIEIKEVTVSYRQSRQLNELARSIVLATCLEGYEVTLPKYVDNEGVAPALLEHASTSSAVSDWLAQRIREIESFVKKLPSIAIFVESEVAVQQFADALKDAIADDNIRVVACHNGQVMGQDSDVRIFDVQHIKGLEFEAVFFIGIDRLAELHPQLFDKYLYVGTTRAATYLGVTCDKALPASIEMLRPLFVSNWNNA